MPTVEQCAGGGGRSRAWPRQRSRAPAPLQVSASASADLSEPGFWNPQFCFICGLAYPGSITQPDPPKPFLSVGLCVGHP